MASSKHGIYKITNTVNGKIYIGSSSDVKHRKWNHFKTLRTNTNHNQRLQNAYNKYGKDNFKFEILELCSKDDLIKCEQHYLDTLLFAQEYIRKEDKRFLKLGYNIRPIAESNQGIKRPDKIGFIANYNRLFPQITKPVFQIDINTLQIINGFDSCKDAANFIGCDTNNMRRTVLGSKFYKNYFWIYSSDTTDEKLLSIQKRYLNLENRGARSIVRVDKGGNILESFISVSQAAEKYNLATNNISKACNGKLNSAGKIDNSKMYWRYK